MFDDELVTVWSAPNYCYRCGNMASILTIRDDGERKFTVYGAAEENDRDQNMQNGKLAVCFATSFVVIRKMIAHFYLGQHAVLCLIFVISWFSIKDQCNIHFLLSIIVR